MAKNSTILARSKTFERFMAFVIGGSRVYGQSAKNFVKSMDGEDVVGDVKNDYILGECKAYDCATGTKWRKDNPHAPAKTMSIQISWLNQVFKEGEKVSKRPFLAFNPKHEKLSNTYIIIHIDFFLFLLNKLGWSPYDSIKKAWLAWTTRGGKIENPCTD